MPIFASKSAKGFIDSRFGGKIPDDAIEITPKQHRDLLDAESSGKVIVWNEKSIPITEECVGPDIKAVEILRIQAYSHPVNGSDRYFAESLRKSMMGDSEGAKIASDKGNSRFEEIQKEYPYPEEK